MKRMELKSLSQWLWRPYLDQLGDDSTDGVAKLFKEIPWCSQLVECIEMKTREEYDEAKFAKLFDSYERLDLEYLRVYVACIGILVCRLPSENKFAHFRKELSEMFSAGQQEFSDVLKNIDDVDSRVEKRASPSFRGYIDYLAMRGTAALQGDFQSVFNLAVSLAPCFVAYADIGKRVGKLHAKPKTDWNPCSVWLSMYAAESFQKNTLTYSKIVDELGLVLSRTQGIDEDAVRKLAQPIYAKAMEYELGIFNEFSVGYQPLEETCSTAHSARTYPQVLIVAGSDSGGGAGIQADIKTCEAFGVFSCTAIVALTAQNTCGVDAVMPVGPDFIGAQLDSIIKDYENLAVVKTGMLPDENAIDTLLDKLSAKSSSGNGDWFIVVDPVIVATSGDRLIPTSAVEAIKTKLLRKCLICTPNRPEVATLLSVREEEVYKDNKDDNAARFLQTFGCFSALFKGGHEIDNNIVDTLYISLTDIDFDKNYESDVIREVAGIAVDPILSHRVSVVFSAKILKVDIVHQRIYPNQNRSIGHGSGCTLSSAIAASLAKQISTSFQHIPSRRDVVLALCRATLDGVKYTHKAIERAQYVEIGKGNGPVIHHS